MTEKGDNNAAADIIAELRRESALRDVEIADKKEQLAEATTSYRTVIALKNREIKNLKEEIANLKTTITNSKVKDKATDDKAVAKLTKMEQKMSNMDARLDCFMRGTNQNTIRARFEEISKLTSDVKYSQSLNVVGIDWRIGIAKEDGFLRLDLKAMNFTSRCSAFFKFQLISHKSEKIFEATNTNDVASVFAPGQTWSYDKVVSFEDLFDKEKAFVEEDSILVSVVIKAFLCDPN